MFNNGFKEVGDMFLHGGLLIVYGVASVLIGIVATCLIPIGYLLDGLKWIGEKVGEKL